MSTTIALSVFVVPGLADVAPMAMAASTNGNPEAGKKTYLENCQSCHGATGRGDSDMGAYLTPPPANLAARKTQARTAAELRKIILEGRPGTAVSSYEGSFRRGPASRLDGLHPVAQAVRDKEGGMISSGVRHRVFAGSGSASWRVLSLFAPHLLCCVATPPQEARFGYQVIEVPPGTRSLQPALTEKVLPGGSGRRRGSFSRRGLIPPHKRVGEIRQSSTRSGLRAG